MPGRRVLPRHADAAEAEGAIEKKKEKEKGRREQQEFFVVARCRTIRIDLVSK
jgi:hypothetical protein